MEGSLGMAIVVMLIAAVLASVIKDPKTRLKLFGGGAALFVIYWIFVRNLPSYVIAQSFPYTSSHRTDVNNNIWATLITTGEIFWSYFNVNWITRSFGVILLFSLIRLIDGDYRRKIQESTRTFLFPVFISLGFFLTFSLHEFIASGVYYRLDWIKSLWILPSSLPRGARAVDPRKSTVKQEL